MAAINGREVNQVIFNNQEVFVLKINNEVNWVKPNYVQTFSVQGRTGSIGIVGPTGTVYEYSNKLYVGTEITNATITGANNTVSISNGVITYKIYGSYSNSMVSAEITLSKIKHYSITVSGMSGSRKLLLGYAFSISTTIEKNATNVEITEQSSGTSNVKLTYDQSTGSLNINGYHQRANYRVSLTVEYYA